MTNVSQANDAASFKREVLDSTVPVVATFGLPGAVRAAPSLPRSKRSP